MEAAGGGVQEERIGHIGEAGEADQPAVGSRQAKVQIAAAAQGGRAEDRLCTGVKLHKASHNAARTCVREEEDDVEGDDGGADPVGQPERSALLERRWRQSENAG